MVESLGDVEREALRIPVGAVPPPALALPLEAQHALAALQFLKDQLWEARAEFVGLLCFGGRVWAIRSGLEVTLEQLTGAPARWRWHEWEGGSPLAWTELGAAEVWRIGLPHPGGALYSHYRPQLAPLPHAPSIDADGFAAAAQAHGSPAPAVDDAHGQASRQARRRRKKRGAMQGDASMPAPVPAPVPVPALSLAPTPRAMRTAPRPAPKPAPMRAALPPLKSRRRAIAFGVAASAIVAAIVATGVAARKPIRALMVGRYTLGISTSPAGARVRVDGRPQPGRTPLAIALEPGGHRVDVSYGEYASTSFQIDGARGEQVRREFAWTGSLGVACADSTARLAVLLDGKALGLAPLWRDQVPVGRHRLGFTAPGVRAWEEEVQVRAGQSARVSAVPIRVPNYGLVTARAELVSSDGVEDLDGMPVFVDGQRVGATPLDLKLAPGPHSIKIARAEGAPSIHLIDVQPGGRFYASAEFGRPADPMVAFEAPARIARSAPPALAIRLVADMPLPVRQASVYLRPEGESFARLPVTWAGGHGQAQGTFLFPVERLGTAHSATYYVAIETREGEEYFSELHTIPIVP